MHVNVQSICNKIVNLELLLAEERPSIVSIVEHWCSAEKLSSYCIYGYVQAASYCRLNYGHGGTVLLVRADLLVCTTSALSMNTFFFYPVLREEIIQIVKTLKNKKSTGIDQVSVGILKAMVDVVAKPLADLINLSVNTDV
ncbi:uncharacterized protein LOC123672463 [Harmonia axyridis]|uniref:uncharacterized protein LOC123672463 n=1 Tax=Harmonia axyridis TaxID=115357 RepID=UPI001E27682D|nr:uncharacterized protein LOC123672463 [Harmonia axyridis]